MPPHAARWLREQVLFLLVLAVFAGGFGYLIYGHGHWVRSTFVMGCAMVLAGGLRAAVPARLVGLLAVRARWIDALVYLALGGVVLAVDIRLHQ